MNFNICEIGGVPLQSPSQACSHRDQIDQGHCVVVDVPQCHDANSIHDDHDDGDQVEKAGAEVKPQQKAAHHECGQQTQGDVEESLWHNSQVLLVKHISEPGTRRKAK